MRREKSLRIGVHHANGVVWGPVYRTRLGGFPALGFHERRELEREQQRVLDVRLVDEDMKGVKARSIHWSPYDCVRVVNADP